MKESTLVQMRRDIKNLSITVAILIERLKKLENANTEEETK
jgi:uncharacterized coiled-coil protein SlyX